MSTAEKFYFSQRNWPVFTKLDEIFNSLVNEKGEPILENISDIGQFKKDVKPNQVKSLTKYLQFLDELHKKISGDFYSYIPEKSISILLNLQIKISDFNTKTRSIRSIYKSPTFMQKMEHTFSQLSQIINQVLTSYCAVFSQIEIANIGTDQKDQPLDILHNQTNIWMTFESIKKIDFEINRNFPNWMKFSDDIVDFHQILRSFLESHKQGHFKISQILDWTEFNTKSNFRDNQFKNELFQLFYDLNLMIPVSSVKDFPKDVQKVILQEAKVKVNDLLIQKTNELIQNGYAELKFTEIPKNDLFTKTFNPLFLDWLKQKQGMILEESHGDLKSANGTLQELGNNLYLFLDELENWILLIKPYLIPIEKITNKFKQAISHLRGDINQQLEDFEQYVLNLEQNQQKIEIEEQIDIDLKKLDQILLDYQNSIDPLIPKQFPDIDSIKTIIHTQKTKLEELNTAAQQLFDEFKDKKVEMVIIAQTWDLKYQEITDKLNFSIKTALHHIFHQFNSVLQKEQIFLETLSSRSNSRSIQNVHSGNFLLKESYSEDELRTRIKFLDNKIDYYHELTTDYQKEKELFVSKLELVLKETGLESKKCIICHKEVNVAEDHFIKCEFCGSLSHYSCAVWWLNKYNSCPVCHHKYTLPHNGIYDPNGVEE